jgi:hypothetical protein
MTSEKEFGTSVGCHQGSGIWRVKMSVKIRTLLFAAFEILMLPWVLMAQESSTTPVDPQAGEVIRGGYVVHQSTELGYRFQDRTGSEALYDTVVDLHRGPRILEQTLSMRSENNQGLLFDNLSISSFGWGGDPENVLRAHVEKNKWFHFQGSFRRNQNYFDYDLLANPLNPTTSTPNAPVLQSPHAFYARRRMSDVDLTLLPQSRLSFRLGYSRTNMAGSSYSSVHVGTDALLYQPWNTATNSYRLGVDWRLAPRTVLSYDQFLSYYKGDTSWQLGAFESGLLAGGASVELGLPINTGASQPCAAPLLITGEVNPACNGYFAYQRLQRTRTSFRTEQLSLRSNYFQRLDFSGRFSYSDGSLKVPDFSEIFDGLASRTRTRISETGGSDTANPVNVNADFGTTWRVTSRLRVVDNFRFDNFRIPGVWSLPTVTLFGATLLSTPNVFDVSTCPPPFTAATCPQHNTSSGADAVVDVLNSTLKQDRKTNTIQLQYDITSKWMARVGYRYQHRSVAHTFADVQAQIFYPTLPNRGACAGLPLNNGVCTVSTTVEESSADDIDSHSLLAGFSVRLSGASRVTYDGELLWADSALTRVSPRRESRNRLQGTYSPRRWMVLGGSLNFLQDSNGDSLTDYRSHFRNYGFSASLTPKERFGIDLAYNYSDVLQNAFICFNDTPPTGVVLPVVTNATTCADDTGNPLRTDSYYVNNTHFGMGTVMLKPVKRVTTKVGYSITNVDGRTPQFNILQPLGSLAYNYHLPVANLGVDLGHSLSWNAGWNYYQYGERSFVGPTGPRYFHANTATLSLEYAF